jgi:hypothetical protein
MYFDNGSVKSRQHLRDSFTVSIELTQAKDDWRLVGPDSRDFPHGIATQGKKTRNAAETVTLAAEQKDRSTCLFVEHVNGLVTCWSHRTGEQRP